MSNVLVVDDSSDTCDTLVMALELKGHDVRCSYTTDDAVTKIRSSVPDVILLDYIMPGSLKTDDFVKWVQSLNCKSKMVLVTGIEDPVLTAKRMGLEFTLSKPYDVEKLYGLLA
jgi:DNA-binding NtrC family response regulator